MMVFTIVRGRHSQRLTLGLLSILVSMFWILLNAPTARGQARTSGTVSGNITDSQGNVVTTATATLSSSAQGKSFVTRANEKGEYLFTDVPVGNYDLRVTANTFQAYIINSIEVDAEQNVRLDAHLQVGTATESVTVEAAGITIDTRSATIGTIIENKLVEELPSMVKTSLLYQLCFQV